MTPILQVVLAVVLVVLCACLVPLLLQLRKTAAAIQGLAESARTDLSAIAADVHQVSVRVDELADLAATGLEGPAHLGAALSNLAQALPGVLLGATSRWMDVALAVAKVAMAAWTRRKEKTHE